jgi:putative N6-adenine-specific DNA methylase
VTKLRLFATCLPGLEPLLAGELRGLGAEPEVRSDVVAFAGDTRLLLRAELLLGTATQLFVHCGDFRCRSLGELERKTSLLPWNEWLRPRLPVTVTAKAKKSRLYHTGAIAERVRNGIAAKFGSALPVAKDAESSANVAVRFFDDHCSIALATAPTPLHRRGWRLETGKAPLREDLAFALLLAAEWQPGTALLDPFCGAGTIAIEAAGRALGLPPGRLRPPPLQHTALFDARLWRDVVKAATVVPPATAPIAASDRDQGAVDAAAANAERAGVAAAIDFRCCALAAQPWLAKPADAPKTGVLVTNPPFGVRVPKADNLLPLYQTLGHRLQQLGDGWRAAILAHDARLARRIGVPLHTAFGSRHGGLKVTAMCTSQVMAKMGG